MRRGIIPFFPDEIDTIPISKLWTTLWLKLRTMDKRIVATFTGKFTIKKDHFRIRFSHLRFKER